MQGYRESLHKPSGKRPLQQHSGNRVMEQDGICQKSGKDTVTAS